MLKYQDIDIIKISAKLIRVTSLEVPVTSLYISRATEPPFPLNFWYVMTQISS